MAGRRVLYAGGESKMINGALVHGHGLPSSSSSPPPPSETLNSLFFSGSSSPFLGSRNMVSFQGGNGTNKSENSFFRSLDGEENGDEDLDDYLHQPEKKRRLTSDQVQFLEKSFEIENKLEPERKLQLAKDLGLQPRQIAIWFQNRRARWRTKQLEKDYEALQASYDSLKVDYDNLLKEKEELKAEVLNLTDKLLGKDNVKGCSNLPEAALEPVADSASEEEVCKVSALAFKQQQEDISSAKSDVVDSESPHYTDGVHSSFLEPGDSSYVFEPDQSDLSQDEEDNLSKNFFPSAYVFPKIEDADYPDQPASSCYFGFPVEDHTFGFWSY